MIIKTEYLSFHVEHVVVATTLALPVALAMKVLTSSSW